MVASIIVTRACSFDKHKFELEADCFIFRIVIFSRETLNQMHHEF